MEYGNFISGEIVLTSVLKPALTLCCVGEQCAFVSVMLHVDDIQLQYVTRT